MHKERLAKISKQLDKAKVSNPKLYHHVENVDLTRIEKELSPRKRKSRSGIALEDINFNTEIHL